MAHMKCFKLCTVVFVLRTEFDGAAPHWYFFGEWLGDSCLNELTVLFRLSSASVLGQLLCDRATFFVLMCLCCICVKDHLVTRALLIFASTSMMIKLSSITLT